MLSNKTESKADFCVKTLKRYAQETGNTIRSTTDLSPLEEWLLMRLYDRRQVAGPQVNCIAHDLGKGIPECKVWCGEECCLTPN